MAYKKPRDEARLPTVHGGRQDITFRSGGLDRYKGLEPPPAVRKGLEPPPAVRKGLIVQKDLP